MLKHPLSGGGVRYEGLVVSLLQALAEDLRFRYTSIKYYGDNNKCDDDDNTDEADNTDNRIDVTDVMLKTREDNRDNNNNDLMVTN